MATNGTKFKTAKERFEEFEKFCEKYTCDTCPAINKKHTVSLAGCAFNWLDLEYKEELKTCPFCGSEASIISGTEDHCIICRNDDCVAALVARSFSSPEEAIAAWNKRTE